MMSAPDVASLLLGGMADQRSSHISTPKVTPDGRYRLDGEPSFLVELVIVRQEGLVYIVSLSVGDNDGGVHEAVVLSVRRTDDKGDASAEAEVG